MKLIKYDASVAGTKTGISSITFGNKGLISISKTACELMKLKPGDPVSFFQDPNALDDWYIGKDKDGIPLRDYGKMGIALNCSRVTNDLKRSINPEGGGGGKISSLPDRIGIDEGRKVHPVAHHHKKRSLTI